MKRLFFVVALLLAPSCNEFNTIPTEPSDQPPSNGRPVQYTIEYRVFGTATSALIRYSNSDDGLNQVVTALPWSFTTGSNRDINFLSIEVQAQSFGSLPTFMNGQILINGSLLREVSTINFFTPLLVQATYRR